MSDEHLPNTANALPHATQQAESTPAQNGQVLGLRLFCLFHCLSGWLAAGLSWVEVESIVGTLPVIVILGLIVTWLAMRRTSWLLLCYGLSGLCSVAIVSLVIAANNLGPSEAVPTVPNLLTVCALIITGLYAAVAWSVAKRLDDYVVTGPLLKFRVTTLMLLATVVCVLSAVGKFVSWHGEMWIFASGGLVLLGLSTLFATLFARRLQKAKAQRILGEVDQQAE